MKFDESRVFTPLNADELRPGDKVIVADALAQLRNSIENDTPAYELDRVCGEHCRARFELGDCRFILAYLVERGEE